MKAMKPKIPLKLMVLAILAYLPTYEVLAADIYINTMTVLNSKFEITNREIENNATFSMTGTGLVSAQNIGNGLYQIEDNFSTVRFSTLGNYSPYKLGLKLRNSRINIKMVGQKLGHSFNVKGRYLSAVMNAKGIRYYNTTGGNLVYYTPTNSGGNCIASLPNPYSSTFTFSIIGNSTDVSKFCQNADTGIYAYLPKEDIINTSMHGNSRVILLDIGGLQRNLDYRKAPPDIYIGRDTSDMSSGFSVERWEEPTAYYMRYQNNITIQKNPYFEGITLPAGDNVFDVKKVSNKLKGNLTIPYVMNGQFTPYNTIKLEVASNNGFKLKDASNNEIPYSLSTTLGVRKLNIADKGTVVNPQSVITFTDLSKEFYALQGRFDADFSASSSIQTGDYTDTVTAVYTLSL